MPSIFVMEAESAPVHLHVNGRSAVILVGVDAEIDEFFIPALKDAGGIKWRYTGDPGPADETRTEGFDAEAIITGNVEEVAGRLSLLTAEQLLSVRAAETDREQSRKGVLAAIDKTIDARNQGTPS